MRLDLDPRPLTALVPGIAGDGPGLAAPRAAGSRTVIQDEDSGVTLPPAGASRAEALFTAVGVTLFLVILLSALWILIRHRH